MSDLRRVRGEPFKSSKGLFTICDSAQAIVSSITLIPKATDSASLDKPVSVIGSTIKYAFSLPKTFDCPVFQIANNPFELLHGSPLTLS
ncbi:hypothetical protein NPIL_23791 [Nephila pilipes]|uniref:Uncharacterized protein n=1 Tax=Nephila pilipes TaxID=299642 RepID=A0A8X6INA9_NEPPI|nr:hypothetical protein NPIL_23791 [Nephila pilipes]